MAGEQEITRLLREVDEGRPEALDELMEVVYSDLERVAQAHMDREFGAGHPGITLEPAALVNETYMRLIRQRKRFDNRGQFFAIATKVMLRVLLDHSRRRRAAKRGGDRSRITLLVDHADPRSAPQRQGIEIEHLVDALEQLGALDRRKAEVVEMRVVWGLTMPEIAGSLELSVATIERDWAFAKAFLLREAGAAGGESGPG